MKPVTVEVLPVDASRSGRNTVYHHCDQIERRTSYAVCLFTLAAHEKGKLRPDSECYQHIQRGECKAVGYRQQEIEAGRALFYQERQISTVKVEEEPRQEITGPTKPDSESYMRGWMAAGRILSGGSGKSPARPAARPTPLRSAPKPTPTASERLFGVKESTLADAVSDAATEAVIGKKEPTPLVQYVAKLIRSRDRDLWRLEMGKIISKFRLDKDAQTRLVTAAKNLAATTHPLDKASIPNMEPA